MTKRRHTPLGGANELFFRIDDGPPTAWRWRGSEWRELHRVLSRARRGKKAEGALERGERTTRTPSARATLVLTPGIFRRQAFRKIYGEVTAWIAMNSAHPPLSGLVIVLNLLALAGVTCAYTCASVCSRACAARFIPGRQRSDGRTDDGNDSVFTGDMPRPPKEGKRKKKIIRP